MTCVHSRFKTPDIRDRLLKSDRRTRSNQNFPWLDPFQDSDLAPNGKTSWLLRTWFDIAPVHKLMSLAMILYSTEHFGDLHFILSFLLPSSHPFSSFPFISSFILPIRMFQPLAETKKGVFKIIFNFLDDLITHLLISHSTVCIRTSPISSFTF